jgi:hypothetical protein
MSNPAVGAKYIAAVVVGLVGAGAFAGVSHDGRGGASPEDPAPVVDTPPSTALPSTSLPSTSLPSTSLPSISRQVETTLAAEPVKPALPTPPDPVPTRARVRSRGS